MKFHFRKQDGLATLLELIGLGLVRGFTYNLIPKGGVVKKITDIACGAAAATAVLSYTVPKVTDFVKVSLKNDEKHATESAAEESESDVQAEEVEEPVPAKKKLVNIISGAFTDSIMKVLDEKHFQCIKIDNADPKKEMIFAVLTPDAAEKIKQEFDCEVFTVKEPVSEEPMTDGADDISEGESDEQD